MFYLLEDNRIIDSEELKRKLHLDAKLGIIDNELIVTLENFPIYRSESKIKKQSENVYDLIEKGDLVKTIVDLIYQVVMIAKNTIIAPQWAFDLAVVTAIYKPDEKGNYIKVWEKKDE